MALGSAYGIERYSDEAETKVNKDYSRYQVIRTALLFGYQIERVSEDRIVLYNMLQKPAVGLLVNKDFSYSMFALEMEHLTENYNNVLKKLGKNVLPYDLYREESVNPGDRIEEAYPHAQDPIIKAALFKNKLDPKKGDAFARQVDEQMKRSIVVLKEVTWGKNIAPAIEYFWHHNRRNLIPESQQLGE